MRYQRDESLSDPIAANRTTAVQRDGIPWLVLPYALMRGRALLVKAAFVGVLVGVLVAVLVPKRFESQSLLTPIGASASSRVGSLLSGFAGQFGINLSAPGNALPLDFFARLATARTTLERVAATPVHAAAFTRAADTALVPLADLIVSHRVDPPDRRATAVRELADRLSVSTDAVANSLRLSFRNGDPFLAQFVLARLVSTLNEVALETQRRAAAEQSAFVREQLRAARDDVRALEDSLRRFYEQNRSFSESPRLMFEELRLRSEVERARSVHNSLEEQRVLTEHAAALTVPLLLPVDTPHLPDKPVGPRRLLIVLGVATLVILAAAVTVAVQAWSRDDRVQHPEAWSALEEEARATVRDLRQLATRRVGPSAGHSKG